MDNNNKNFALLSRSVIERYIELNIETESPVMMTLEEGGITTRYIFPTVFNFSEVKGYICASCQELIENDPVILKIPLKLMNSGIVLAYVRSTFHNNCLDEAGLSKTGWKSELAPACFTNYSLIKKGQCLNAWKEN